MVYVLAGVLAVGIILIFVALASEGAVDPVQARLTQLGNVQARNLEELELQQPFSERTLRPLVARLSRAGSRLSSASSSTLEKGLSCAISSFRPAIEGLPYAFQNSEQNTSEKHGRSRTPGAPVPVRRSG